MTNPDQSIVRTEKQFSDSLTQELTDEEIARCTKILIASKRKWENKFRSKFRDISNISNREVEEALDMIEEFNDEISYEMATKVNVLVKVDVTPILEGKGMFIDYLGTVDQNKSFDHDKKGYEVKKARDRKEAFLGQKENPNSSQIKNRFKNE